MSAEPSEMFWYNLKTGHVEQGFVSASTQRVGPFATGEEAAHALDRLRENSKKWAEEDAADDLDQR